MAAVDGARDDCLVFDVVYACLRLGAKSIDFSGANGNELLAPLIVTKPELKPPAWRLVESLV